MDELEADFMCQHVECPYQYCPYHRDYDDSLDVGYLFVITDINNGESPLNCMSYLDI